jgi:hypothetical protein
MYLIERIIAAAAASVLISYDEIPIVFSDMNSDI